ncbi:MAG TPA: family 10 glycosylhydrolase, partial [Mariniphaga sp.]|nr:family 10 glycosylhydrolase [Mariniphaga sp.]
MKTRLLLLLIISISLSAMGQAHPPKFEFRAVWVASVANIDWPSEPGLTSEEQQAEIISILDRHQNLGMNAVILQIRPTSDAFYPSGFEPWSRYLTGEPGKAPEPFYDPLYYWIQEAHKRGMELHAWLNPYRVALNHNQPLAFNHIAFTHPEWVLKYGNSLYFDPGLPETREFVTQVVKDIVTRYDVDAIHFDDYFYPYPLPEPFPDTTSFKLHSRGFFPENKADWRRENVDILIKMLNDTIKSVKPWVKFGISPFGVWRNIANDPNGSISRAGVTNYDHLYADIIKWQAKGWIDYTLPQLYWHIGHPLADFETLARWWQSHTYGRGMYIGIGLYKSDANATVKQWADPAELPRQIKLLRQIPGLDGAAYYSSKHFNRDLLGFQDSLMHDLYKHPALTPTMPWISTDAPQPVKKFKKRGRTIKWKTKDAEHEFTKPKAFVVYLVKKGEHLNPENPENIHVILTDDENKFKFDRINRKKEKYEVRISVINRLNNESWL